MGRPTKGWIISLHEHWIAAAWGPLRLTDDDDDDEDDDDDDDDDDGDNFTIYPNIWYGSAKNLGCSSGLDSRQGSDSNGCAG